MMESRREICTDFLDNKVFYGEIKDGAARELL